MRPVKNGLNALPLGQTGSRGWGVRHRMLYFLDQFLADVGDFTWRLQMFRGLHNAAQIAFRGVGSYLRVREVALFLFS